MAEGLQFDLRLTRPGGFTLAAMADLPPFGITALHGPSGSGKSTILRAIAGLEPGVDGDVRFAGQDWMRGGVSRCPVHRRGVGVLFQDARLFEHMDVAQNLAFGASRRGDRNAPIPRDTLVEMLDLGPLLSRAPATLSGGERQRVALARALLSAPRLLLMDEPVSAVDLDARNELLQLLDGALAEAKLPALLVSHALDEVTTLATAVHPVRAGRLGPPQPFALGPDHWVLRGLAATSGQGVVVEDGGWILHLRDPGLAGSELAVRLDASRAIPSGGPIDGAAGWVERGPMDTAPPMHIPSLSALPPGGAMSFSRPGIVTRRRKPHDSDGQSEMWQKIG